MYPLQNVKQQAVNGLRKAIGKGFTVSGAQLEVPPKADMGDLAFPCFQLAKEQGRNPAEIATELAAKMAPTELIERITSTGPYVNFFLNRSELTEAVLETIDEMSDKYGTSTVGEGTKVLIEYASLNTHKEFHVGHIRNVVLGQSLINIYEANGYDVQRVCYLGDIGAHVAKVIWALVNLYPSEKFEKETRAKRLGEIYAEATQYLAEHPEVKEDIDEVQRKLEARDPELTKLWKETRQWSIDYLKKGFAMFNAEPEHWYFESEVEQPGKDMVKQMLVDGVAKKSEGAVIVDLEEEGLGAFLILKSDGSSLYSTKDLALAYKKREDLSPDRQLFIVDERQAHHFKQLFATLKRLGFKNFMHHVSYDFVTLADGAMSSRKGNVVTLDETIQKMTEVLKQETAERHEDWKEKKVEEVAKAIALASITFMMLRQDPKTLITFEEKEAMSFDGFTGPYVLYAIARIERILEKADAKPVIGELKEAIELEIGKKLSEYPEVVADAALEYNPSKIAHYVFELAKLSAEYYHEVRILDGEEKMLSARLALLEGIKQTLENGLELLSISSVKEM